MGRRSKYPAELRERAVRLVLEQQGDARFAMGGDQLDRREDGLLVGDVA